MPGRLTGALVVTVMVTMVSGCTTANPAPSTTAPVSSTAPVDTSAPVDTAPAAPDDVPAADRAAVTALIDTINATAAGPVDRQQQVFTAMVDPALAAGQTACAPATITIRIDPVFSQLRRAEATPAADSTGSTGSTGSTDSTDTATLGRSASGSSTVDPPPTGTHYRLPALLEVYTDVVRTGTDLTALDVTVNDTGAHTFPLCLV